MVNGRQCGPLCPEPCGPQRGLECQGLRKSVSHLPLLPSDFDTCRTLSTPHKSCIFNLLPVLYLCCTPSDCATMSKYKVSDKYVVELGEERTAAGDVQSASKTFRAASCPEGNATIEATTVFELFERSAKKYADLPALGHRPINNGIAGDFTFITYKEAHVVAGKIACALAKLGVTTGSRVGVYGGNCVEWMLAMQVSFRGCAGMVWMGLRCRNVVCQRMQAIFGRLSPIKQIIRCMNFSIERRAAGCRNLQ